MKKEAKGEEEEEKNKTNYDNTMQQFMKRRGVDCKNNKQKDNKQSIWATFLS